MKREKFWQNYDKAEIDAGYACGLVLRNLNVCDKAMRVELQRHGFALD